MSNYNKYKSGKYLRSFKERPVAVLGRIVPPKKERKSSFNQLAATKKHECKMWAEYIIGLYERDYELNEMIYEQEETKRQKPCYLRDSEYINGCELLKIGRAHV